MWRSPSLRRRHAANGVAQADGARALPDGEIPGPPFRFVPLDDRMAPMPTAAFKGRSRRVCGHRR